MRCLLDLLWPAFWLVTIIFSTLMGYKIRVDEEKKGLKPFERSKP